MADPFGRDLDTGTEHWRAYVGSPRLYDVAAATQFCLMTSLGLREHHYLLDIGCGSLRGGRLFIPYLLPGHYYGIEPNEWLVREGLKNELGAGIVDVKQPTFRFLGDFQFGAFHQQFDYILAQSVFSHAPKWMIRKCMAEAAKVMWPWAVFVATFFEGFTDYAGQDWSYPGAEYKGHVQYRFDSFVEMAQEEGLSCERIKWPHYAKQTWVRLSSTQP